jgi:DNA-binding transcriptional ArsR family regulator
VFSRAAVLRQSVHYDMNIQIMVNDAAASAAIAPEMAIDRIEVLQVLADSQRHQLVKLLIDEALTVRELAERLGLARTRLYYHLDLLQSHGIVRVVETRIVSGIEERRFRAVARCFRVDRTLLASQASESQIAAAQAAILETVAADLRTRASSGPLRPGPSDDDVLVARTFVRLSDARLRELRVRLKALLDEFDDKDPAGHPAELALALFATERATA